MNNTYIKFVDSDTQTWQPNLPLWKRVVKTLLIPFIPTGNPNFEDEIGNVREWLIEFKSGNQWSNREIGLDFLQQPIMIMPWRRNYGYWIDNHLLLKDFKAIFNAVEITKEEFEKYWNEFAQQNENT